MSSSDYPLHTKGIFKSLPTFSPDLKDLTAIVTGANGISGFHTMRVLLEAPQRWKKVWAASRRPPPEEMMALLPAEQRARVEHVALDFLSSPEEIAKELKAKGVTADAVFFYSYAQPKNATAEAMVDVNSALLRNFIEALPKADIEPSRILLQIGAKTYGVHLGPARTPHVESDPRIDLEPNFYYPQEDILYQYCKDHPETKWNVIVPAWIIGAVNNAAMNALHPLAVYAAVQAHKREPLHFPGDYDSWMGVNTHSSAKLTGYLSEWAALEEKCANQTFNASDDSPLPNNRLWPELARWYGAEAGSGPELDESKLTTIDPGNVPTPLGYGPPLTPRFSFTLSQWAGKEENQAAWKEVMKKEGVTHNPFEDIEANFSFGEAVAWARVLQISMNKARYFGWTGHVDTLESLFLAYGEFQKIGMLPPMVVDKANPLI
nr:hypothetical protein B0A51_13730 [Rachicladosporium sp. CCFEE 5018]